VAGTVEASVVAAAISQVVVAVSAVAISLGLPGVVLVAVALRNTEEGISSTEIVSGTIAISFLEVPFCMITPTTGMIIRTTGMIIRTGTTDIRTIDRTTAFAVSGSGEHRTGQRPDAVSEVVLSEIAQSDLTDIWVFVAQDDASAAELIDRIREKCQMLATTPKVGRQRPELDPSIRSFPVGNYAVFYRERATGIEVARVLHGRRIQSLLRS
jgi:toxin ParE1/3/4